MSASDATQPSSSLSTTKAAPHASYSLKVSFPEHLYDDLKPLLSDDIPVPPDLRRSLSEYVGPTFTESSTELPYDILASLSKWTQSSEGKEALNSNALDPLDYTRISLLSGLKLNPSSKLPPPPRNPEPEELVAQTVRDRKALTVLVNALFSIIGVGAAAWKAAESVRWSVEKRTLLSLFAAFVVAISEGVLYLIWSTRASSSLPKRKSPISRGVNNVSKKYDLPDEPESSDSRLSDVDVRGLRRRLNAPGDNAPNPDEAE